jgi:hypothetical protein
MISPRHPGFARIIRAKTWALPKALLPRIKAQMTCGQSPHRITCQFTRLYLDQDIRSCAAYQGHLKILKWARNNLGIINRDLCSYAAFGGQLETLRWAIKNGHILYISTCADATRNDPSFARKSWWQSHPDVRALILPKANLCPHHLLLIATISYPDWLNNLSVASQKMWSVNILRIFK